MSSVKRSGNIVITCRCRQYHCLKCHFKDTEIFNNYFKLVDITSKDDDDSEFILYLKNFKGDVNGRASSGSTTLHTYCNNCHLYPKYVIYASILLERKDIDVNMKSRIDGCTPLIYACARKCAPLIKLILKKNPDLTIKDKYGYTALDYVESSNKLSSLLLDYQKKNK